MKDITEHTSHLGAGIAQWYSALLHLVPRSRIRGAIPPFP